MVLEGYCNAVNSAAIQGNKVISGSRDKTVRIWDLNHPKSEPVVLYFENIVWSLSISTENVLVVRSGNDAHFLRLLFIVNC